MLGHVTMARFDNQPLELISAMVRSPTHRLIYKVKLNSVKLIN